ncbi:MAG: DUF2459 domain-containing protein [Erythrobacter sp.]|nr:DUF2459 domain-containing protein [Erythrobacter sp.]
MLGALGLVVLAFFLAAWIGSAIPAGGALPAPAAGEEAVQIMVETNGTHTSIVVPVANAVKDWRQDFPSASLPRPDGHLPTHLSIGWGEREVFLHVPNWGELRPAAALRIATVGGEAMLRVSHDFHPAADADHRPLWISRAQYQRLVSAIERSLPMVPAGQQRAMFHGTYAADAYYTSNGTYTLANTCNTWVGAALAEAGVPMGWWTPLEGGVMKWIPLPPDPPA